jgi:hypothetical protein
MTTKGTHMLDFLRELVAKRRAEKEWEDFEVPDAERLDSDDLPHLADQGDQESKP